jgi:hypothetical protein
MGQEYLCSQPGNADIGPLKNGSTLQEGGLKRHREISAVSVDGDVKGDVVLGSLTVVSQPFRLIVAGQGINDGL